MGGMRGLAGGWGPSGMVGRGVCWRRMACAGHTINHVTCNLAPQWRCLSVTQRLRLCTLRSSDHVKCPALALTCEVRRVSVATCSSS